jgi:hypothetical protein
MMVIPQGGCTFRTTRTRLHREFLLGSVCGRRKIRKKELVFLGISLSLSESMSLSVSPSLLSYFSLPSYSRTRSAFPFVFPFLPVSAGSDKKDTKRESVVQVSEGARRSRSLQGRM